MIQTFQISGLGSQVVYRPVDIIGSEIPHCPRVNDSSISHLIHTSISFPTLISFIPLFFYFIHLYFTIFCFISFPSASFRLHFASFRLHFVFISLHFASFRFISLHFASFRILVGPKKTRKLCIIKKSTNQNILFHILHLSSKFQSSRFNNKKI